MCDHLNINKYIYVLVLVDYGIMNKNEDLYDAGSMTNSIKFQA